MNRGRTWIAISLLAALWLPRPVPADAQEEGDAVQEESALKTLAGALRGLSLTVAGWWDEFAMPGEPGAEASPDERQRLVDLSARLSQVLAAQRVDVLRAMGAYFETPDDFTWLKVQLGLGDVIVALEELLEDMEGERSDFVLQEAYPELIVTLQTRAGLARRLRELQRPQTPSELRELRQIQAEYILLIGNLELVIAELNAFIQAGEG